MWKANWNKILSLVLLSVVSLNLYINIFVENMDFGEMFWFCDMTTIILSIALWFKNRLIISSVLLASIPAQFLWIVDFFLQIIFGGGLGRTEWLFADNDLWITPWVSTIMHGLLIPSALYGAYKLGFDKKSIWLAYGYAIIILTTSFFTTNPYYNRNCIFYPCDMDFFSNIDFVLGNYVNYNYYFYSISLWIMYGSIMYIILYFVFKKLGRLK